MACAASPACRPVRPAGRHLRSERTGRVRSSTPDWPACAVLTDGSTATALALDHYQVLIYEQLVVDLYSR
jgi:phosphoheptose isomerase